MILLFLILTNAGYARRVITLALRKRRGNPNKINH